MPRAEEHHTDARDLDDEISTRGRRDNLVVQATPKQPEPYAHINVLSTGDFAFGPAPASDDSWSQARASQEPKALRDRTKSEFEEKRLKFVNRFNSSDWNHPNGQHPEMDDLLTQSKALVVAIQYGPSASNLLRGTFVDAYSIVDMLETQFRYPSKCIRVLADQVDQKSKKDPARWPTKDNIKKGIEWLNEKSVNGSRRFLFFAGHGYTSRKDGNELYTEEGILPRDYDTIILFDSDDSSQPKGAVDPDTVLLDYELNRCLVDNVANGVKLTVMFDCCYSGGLSGPVPNIKDMSDLRSRHLFARQHDAQLTGEDKSNIGYAPGLGNLLDLPVKIELGNSDGIEYSTRTTTSQLSVNERDDEAQEFRPFPGDCQVISWCACNGSQLAREDGQGGRFTTAFIKGIKQSGSREISTYRRLNRYISDEFKEHNKLKEPNKIDAPGVSEVHTTNGEPTAVRASPRKSGPGEDSVGQFPKLYVSANIANEFKDKVVEI
ncbi:cytochrome c oxidase subunit 1 [Ceratobasidium sp. 370]|nr:cytochrome c oxidase subunit 1 [Ceratobasidium sp. 370]